MSDAHGTRRLECGLPAEGSRTSAACQRRSRPWQAARSAARYFTYRLVGATTVRCEGTAAIAQTTGYGARDAEVPDDVVFTVEYSVRTAQQAVATLLGFGTGPKPVYKGQHDPKVLIDALHTLHRH